MLDFLLEHNKIALYNIYMNREELSKKIRELKRKYEKVEGTPCEVYSRIVGYHRAVDNWNAGKKEEYQKRKVYEVDYGYEDLRLKTLPSMPESKKEISKG